MEAADVDSVWKWRFMLAYKQRQYTHMLTQTHAHKFALPYAHRTDGGHADETLCSG